jgi:cyclic beta-1,2-glucan synthetase
LGIQQEGNKLKFAPCVPIDWESFKVNYRYMKTVYHIAFTQRELEVEMQVIVDGVEQSDKTITLLDDGAEHNVEVKIGK